MSNVINFLNQIVLVLSFPDISLTEKVSFLVYYILQLIFFAIIPGSIKTFKYLGGNNFLIEGSHKNLLLDHLVTHIKYYFPYYKKVDTIIDVGASFGTFTYLSSYFNHKAHIYSFEMTEQSYSILERNCGNNPKITLTNKAVGKNNSKIKYSIESDYPEGAHIGSAHRGERQLVADQIRLDDFFRKYSLGKEVLLKIDAEGNELNVLQGFSKQIYKCRHVIIETGLDGRNLMAVIRFMTNNKFKLVSTGDVNWIHNKTETEIGSMDLIFRRNI